LWIAEKHQLEPEAKPETAAVALVAVLRRTRGSRRIRQE
jgi:hypothetical protein